MCGCRNLIKAIDAYIAKEDKNLADELGEAGFTEPEKTVKEISELEDSLTEALEQEMKYFKRKSKQAVNLDELKKIWPDIARGDNAEERLTEIFLEDFKKNIPALAAEYIKVIDPQLTVKTITARTTAWAKDWSEELGRLMKLSSHEKIEQLLTDNLKNGKSVADFTRALMDEGIRSVRYQARRVALTETLRAHSVAQQEAITQNPAVDKKEWVHTGNYRNTPRENHVAMSGVIVPKKEPFTLEGADGEIYHPMYPRDSTLPVGETANCHCIHRGVVNDEILGLPLEERKLLQQKAIEEDDGAWERELDARNKAKAGIDAP